MNEQLIESCIKGDMDNIICLINNGCDVNSRYGLPLRLAIINNHANVVKFLLEKGADPNIERNIPVSLACLGGNYEIVSLLLNHGGVCRRGDFNYYKSSKKAKDNILSLFSAKHIKERTYEIKINC